MDVRPDAVPLFPQRGGALFKHVTPSRIAGLDEHREDEIVSADGAEMLHHEVGPEHLAINRLIGL